ncbi:MAG: carbohydrate binding domain-containing protein [Verrucomicrobiota bacterium]
MRKITSFTLRSIAGISLLAMGLIMFSACEKKAPEAQKEVPKAQIDEQAPADEQAPVASAAPLLKNGDFELNAEAWNLGKGFVIEQGGGRSSTRALFFERTDKADISFTSQEVKVVPGAKYRFSAWMRYIRPEGDSKGATLGLEFFENGKFIKAIYPPGLISANDWTKVEGSAVVPDNADSARLVLQIRKEQLGKAWFEDVELKLDEPMIQLNLISPATSTITPQSGLVRFNVYCEDPDLRKRSDELTLRVEALAGGKSLKTLTSPVSAMRAEADLSELPVGEAEMKLTLIDPKNEKTLSQKTLPLTVAPADRPLPANACLIDAQGRAIVNSKPYLPVGLYIDNFIKEDLDRIGASPFNCIMPYHVMVGRFDKTQQPTIESIRECLDYSHEKGLKILFGTQWVHEGIRHPITDWMGAQGETAVITKVVETFKDHPALLAWYLCDELPVSMKDRLEKRRALVNRLDPFHPTWSVFYQNDDLPFMGGGQDVIGVDNYPVRFAHNVQMKIVAKQMDAVDLTGLPTWVVPQAHNMGTFEAKDAEDAKRFLDPTEDQMLSMSLYMAARGAKGFIFYAGNLLAMTDEVFYAPSRNRIKNAPAPQTEADFARRWDEISRVGGVLRGLEAFLLADQAAPEVQVKVEKGEVVAREFRDAHGNVRILIAGVGPGESEAVITTSATMPLNSGNGKTVALGGNQYRFTGKDICSDILSGTR